MSFPELNHAHNVLVKATAEITKPGADPLPISLVSVDERVTTQVIIFDGRKWTKDAVAERLRAAADFLEQHT